MSLSDAQSDLATSNSNLQMQATSDYTTSQTAANDAVNAALMQAADAWTALQSSVAQQEATATTERNNARNKAYDALSALQTGIASRSLMTDAAASSSVCVASHCSSGSNVDGSVGEPVRVFVVEVGFGREKKTPRPIAISETISVARRK